MDAQNAPDSKNPDVTPFFRVFQCPYVKNEIPGRADGRKSFGNQPILVLGEDRIKNQGIMLYRLLTELNLEYWYRDEITGDWALESEQKPDILIMVNGFFFDHFIAHTLDNRFDKWLVGYLNTPRP